MAVPLRDLLEQHSTNDAHYTGFTTGTGKEWSRRYHPITELIPHSTLEFDSQGRRVYSSSFDALGESFADDDIRLSTRVFPPNTRDWRLASESDATAWFHAEVSNIVLGGWAEFPSILQVSEAPPLNDSAPETVDSMYTVTKSGSRIPVILGEYKRNIIRAPDWASGRVTGLQAKLSQELRGYADKYQCPHIFCFDGETLLLLQFRAKKLSSIKDASCKVDCWIIPRRNGEHVALRYALYRFLTQGFRCCQGASSYDVVLGGLQPRYREFFSGRPVWDVAGDLHIHPPGGYVREVDPETGSFYWYIPGNPAPGVLDTQAFWGQEAL